MKKNGKYLINNKGEFFVMLAGEVHNSSSSSYTYMEPIWDKASELELNSLLLPVTWEMIEPEEGKYDFTLVDELIYKARKHDMKICFLWFGAWKNAQCYYVPEWIKTNLQRFRRAEIKKGENKICLEDFYGMPYTTISYLCDETKKVEVKAFKALMSHIKSIDDQDKTVIMIQVENECGIKGAARENSDLADKIFYSSVPKDFIDYMKSNTDSMAADIKLAVENGEMDGDWRSVFGNTAEEIFSAYHIAKYINSIAEEGKKVHNIPMMCNCWLDKGQEPGRYPSGGPVARMMEVWKYCAPSIDIIAPDIYVQNFCDVCDQYVKLNNPLFIPETAIHSYAGSRLVYVIGHYHALGYSPFGIESMGKPFSASEGYLFGMDTSDPMLKMPQDTEEYAWYCKTLKSLMPLFAETYGSCNLKAVIAERPDQNKMIFDEFGFKINFKHEMLKRSDGVCLVLRKGDEFYIIANGCSIMPYSANIDKPNHDILSLEEGVIDESEWKMIRRLNGDEVAMMRYKTPVFLRMKLFNYM